MKMPRHYINIGCAVIYLLVFSCNGNHTATKMIFVEGGNYIAPHAENEDNVSRKISSFYIDAHLVTVEAFEAFTNATGYVTEAEAYGNAAVFDFETQDWDIVEGAYFLYPFGKNKERAQANHPVTQVSWNDAQAYCKWEGKRLPTEAEWEYAALNGGKSNTLYAWGNELITEGKYNANIWQGTFPYSNTKADGFLATSPVGLFGKNEIGLSDMGGNVWQWCSDTVMPVGEDAELDPSPRRVTKGGSFLCDPKVCHGFKVSGRATPSPETALVHTGFRCVKDAE